ncbi:NAD(P)-dependent oxidoreductase [Spirillospora sp. CA-255316]
MKITVIGATGMVGSRVTSEAVGRGHLVTAASRRPPERPYPVGATATVADLTDPRALDGVVTGADAVVVSVRPVLNDEAAVTGTMRRVLDIAAARRARVVVVGGAGPLRSPADPDRLVADDPAYVPEAWRAIAAASVTQLRACERHGKADWTYLSPPAVLALGERTGGYRRGTDLLLTDASGASRITAEDLAVAVVDELEERSGARHLTVAY